MNSALRWVGFSSENRRNRISVLFRFLLVVGLIQGCSLPQAPGRLQWDVLLTVPFGSRTYRLNEMVDPDSAIRERGYGVGMNGDSLLYFAAYDSVSGDFEDSLRLDPFAYRISRPLQAIMLPVDSRQSWYRSLGGLNPQMAIYHGQIENLPQHALTGACAFSLGDDVDSLRVDTGSVTLTVRNDLPYSVDNLEILLRDLHNHRQRLTEIASLSSGDSAQVTVRLDDELIGSLANFEFNATGRGGSQILVDSTQGLAVSAALTTLQCVPFYGVIREQDLTRDSSFTLTQQHRLYDGIVQRGTIDVTLYNDTQLDDSVWIVFPEITSPAGDTLITRELVPAREQRFVQTDLAGYYVRLSYSDPQLIHGTLRSRSFPTANHRVFTGTGDERVEGEFSVSTVSFLFFDGELNNLTVDIPAEGQAVERPPEGWDAVHPLQVDGELALHSAIALAADLTLEISSFYLGALVDSVHVYFPDIYLGADSTLPLPNLAALTSTFPDSFAYSGYLSTRGAVAVYATDQISADISIVAPLRFTLGEVNAPGDVEIVEMDAIDNLQEGSAHIKIWNRLPAGGDAYIIAGHDSTALLPESGQDVDTIYVAVIPTPPISGGRATAEAFAEYQVALTQPILALLEHPPFYFRANIHLPSSGGAERLAHGTDYVTVQVTAQIVHTIDTEDGE
ncbi:hypothetical protein HZB60_01265 [candidate division KSB1 bacterium]|nr:hypothetical protein [candidate division KSB1 bacterium]